MSKEFSRLLLAYEQAHNKYEAQNLYACANVLADWLEENGHSLRSKMFRTMARYPRYRFCNWSWTWGAWTPNNALSYTFLVMPMHRERMPVYCVLPSQLCRGYHWAAYGNEIDVFYGKPEIQWTCGDFKHLWEMEVDFITQEFEAFLDCLALSKSKNKPNPIGFYGGNRFKLKMSEYVSRGYY